MADKPILTVTQEEGVSVVGFGEALILDTYHVNEVSTQLFDLIDKDKRRAIVLDFATIKMLSSQTLGVLLKMKKKLDELGGKIAISGIDPRLYRVFKVTNLQNIFEFYDDNDSAVAALK